MNAEEFDRGGSLAPVVEVSTADFEDKVIRRSRRVPVVVDFWAPWCGPCHMLGPVLERLANEAQGAWQLAKVNVDANQALAARFGVQGIPAVKAFRDGRVAAEFVGAQPEGQVRAFVAALLPSEADDLAATARGKDLAGDAAGAEAAYRRALAAEADHPAALLGLGRVLLAGDQIDEALAILERVPRPSTERAEAETWLAQARFRRESELTGGEIAARRRVAAQPNDFDARLALAAALAAKGSHREALEGLLDVLSRAEGQPHDRARESMLAIFNVLGDRHPLTQEYRARLATTLW